MTAVSIVGLIALIVFSLFLVFVTLVVVKYRNMEPRDKDKPQGHLEEYRRVPLVPDSVHVCADSLQSGSSQRSCSCYSG